MLGKFSAVVRDVGAAKGFLLCTSGFARSNHQYARTLSIELVTIEDIKSDKWKTEVQIPFVYIRKNNNFRAVLDLVPNEALVNKTRDKQLLVQVTTGTLLTDDGGATTVRFQDYVNKSIEALAATLVMGVDRDIGRPNLHILIADVWVPCSLFSFTLLRITKKFYLKYLAPEEYCHLRDHVRETTFPLHVVLSNVGIAFDDSFVELPGDNPPVIPGLFLEVEEWTPVEQVQGVVPPVNENCPTSRRATIELTTLPISLGQRLDDATRS